MRTLQAPPVGPMIPLEGTGIAGMAIGSFTSVTVFGGAAIDRIAMTAAPPVMGASNPGMMRTAPGGVGLNVARVLARLGHNVRLGSRIGTDEAGQVVLAAANDAGVLTGTVGVSAALPTAGYQAALDDSGSLIIGIADMAIMSEITPAFAARIAADSPAADLWVVAANLPAETIEFLVGEAAASGRPIVGLPVSPAKAVRLAPVLDHLGLLFANRLEVAVLLDRDPNDKAASAAFLAEEISRRSAPDVVVTDAEGMVVAASGGRTRAFAPFRATVRTGDGAGEALAAGTLHGLALGRTLFEAVLWGLATAAITVESAGTLPAELTPAMVATRIGAERTAP